MPLSKSVLLAFVVALLPGTALADAVVVTRAMTASTIMEAFIEEDAIVVELEIGSDELGRFPSIVEASAGAQDRPAALPAASELIFLADGARLRGTIESAERRKKVERDEVSGEPLPSSKTEEVLFVVLRYPLRNQPQNRAIIPGIRTDLGTGRGLGTGAGRGG